MATKGINTTINEYREGLTAYINEGIRNGIPLSVIQMDLELKFANIEKLMNELLGKEREQYEQQATAEQEQVKWEDPAPEIIEPEIVPNEEA